MNTRKPGQGSIERLPSGRFRARVVLADGIRHECGTFDAYEEAEGVIAAVLERAADKKLEPVGGATLYAYGWLCFDVWELAGAAGLPTQRSIWRCHVEKAKFAHWPLRKITTRVLALWFEDLSQRPDISDSYVRQILTVIRRVFRRARTEDRIEANPAVALELPRRAAATEEPWTYLDPDEQTALVGVEMAEFWRLAIAFAIGTGIRAGEQWHLHLRDVHVDARDPHIVVRYGGKRRGKLHAPKSRKVREVPLFGLGLAATREWLPLLEKLPNTRELMWPSSSGSYRKVSRYPEFEGESLWPTWIRDAGIARYVRWHDLRHTCGASLVSGWWGRAWRLEEVRDLMGHHSIEETERYAHLAGSALKRAAAETVSTPIPRLSKDQRFSAIRVSEGSSSVGEKDRVVNPSGGHALDALALAYLRAVSEGSQFAITRGCELAKEARRVAASLAAASAEQVNPNPLTHLPRRKSQ